jgi:eukaryotic-like serine/threonine-protein kinase
VFRVGDVIDDRYDVLGPLGQGGMGYVFRARDRRLDRVVALKVLRPHLTETDAERFRREIRALSRLNHPAIVAIYDLGAGEHVYFAMELVEGGTFTDLGPFSEDTEPFVALLTSAVSVAEGLAYVHRLGMVHRDITPRNILLDEAGRPKVMDFGLVQLTETSRPLTRTGSTLGTPQYMAPEQATGDATGATTDLYAFGAVLYRTVTGEDPFAAENDQAIMYQHVYTAPKRAIEVNPRVPPALSALLGRMLAKRPEERPSSAAEVADALRAILQDGLARVAGRPHAGPGRRGVYPSAIADASRLKPVWQVHLDEGPQWPAGLSAADGLLLVGQRSDALAVVRPSDGVVQATLTLDDEVTSPPLVHQGQVWVTTRDGAVVGFAWPSGERLWALPEVEALGLAPLGRDVVVARRDGSLERWGTSPREIRWRHTIDSPATTPVTVAGNLALVATEAGWLHAVDIHAGKPRFQVEIGATVAPVVAAGRLLLIPTRNGEFHAFDLERHEVVWTHDLGGECWAAPVVAGPAVFIATWGERLHAIALRSGDDLWSRPLNGPVTAAPVVAGGNLYLATEGGELLGLDAASGHERMRHRVAAGAVQASPLPYDTSLYVAALDGTLTALR